MGLDLLRLSRTLHNLLVRREMPPPPSGVLALDVASRALGEAIRRNVRPEDVRAAVQRHGGQRLVLVDGGVVLRAASREDAPRPDGARGEPPRPEPPLPEPPRAEPPRATGVQVPSSPQVSPRPVEVARPEPPRPEPSRMESPRAEPPRPVRDARRVVPRGPTGPDILYHATSLSRLAQVRARGGLFAQGNAPVHLSRVEPHAWKVAHRQWADAHVLYIDAARARRDGVRIERTRSGHYAAERIPLRHVLNLREGFAEQASAGGFLVDWSTGAPRIALVRVVRRGGATWEVAKGKIEAGELPTMAATREVREEMGISAGVHVRGDIGTIRYGFATPDGSPRLKTIYLYVLEADGPCAFTPARGEGIDEVRWFELQDALDALAHPSLRGAIGRLMGALEERAAALGLPRPEERR